MMFLDFLWVFDIFMDFYDIFGYYSMFLHMLYTIFDILKKTCYINC